jgi:signal transduction histidine kinase
LQEELARGRSLDQHARFLGLIGEQVDRVERVVEDYQRLGRVQPLRSVFDLHALVQRSVALPPFPADSAIQLTTELAAEPPSCYADPDLVALALENLLRNACEAMPEAGTIAVRTRRLMPSPFVVLSVQDAGVGMDARQRERAFDELYTTKAGGSGLGLAFVKRIADAHGGSVRLSSHVGRGTTVELSLPAAPADGEEAG